MSEKIALLRHTKHGQPHHGLSYTEPISIAFLIITCIAQKPVCTFQSTGQRLFNLVHSKSELSSSLEWISFFSWEIFFMILTIVLSIHKLYFILNHSAHAWLPVKTTEQAYKNMATTKENDNFPSNHKTKGHKNSPNKAGVGCYLGIHAFCR